MKPKFIRGFYLVLLIASLSVGMYVILANLNASVTFFFSPSEIYKLDILPKKIIRLGGLVKEGSIKKIYHESNVEISFVLTDCSRDIDVLYKGSESPLFRDWQGVVAVGKFESIKNFSANTLLIKHDENYRPKKQHDEVKKEKTECQFNPKKQR